MSPSLVVIGNFDGVHRGHQAVLTDVHQKAESLGLAPRLMTFHPHPAVTLGREAPELLTELDRKLELARRLCPSIQPALIEFTPEFAAQSPREFVQNVLVALQAKLVMVGANFRFGRGRAGDIEKLSMLGAEAGFDVAPTELVGDAQPWSSTRVRACIAAGDMEGAAAILGRPHMLSGTVTQGDQRGRKLGFPTCNIPDFAQAAPPHGVYAVLIDRVDDGNAVALARGVANLGVRPTIGDGLRPVLEAHAFDLDQDLYGATLRVHLVSRLRGEQKFDGLDELRAQIALDSAQAKEALATCTTNPAATGAWA